MLLPASSFQAVSKLKPKAKATEIAAPSGPLKEMVDLEVWVFTLRGGFKKPQFDVNAKSTVQYVSWVC